MEKIDISTNSRAISESYEKVVRGDPAVSYVVYSVEKGTLEVSDVGNGSLDEFVENFTDGQVQFGLARVTVPGSDVSKNLLLGWCPDNSPAKQRLSFASNFADVSKILSGYHVQITARDQDDLDVDEFLSRVSASAGARYSIQSGGAKAKTTPAPAKPAVAKSINKPAPKPVAAKSGAFVPKSTGKPIAPVAPITPKPVLHTPSRTVKSSGDDNEEWGGEKEIQERDFEKQPLEDVPSAYKPTKVDIADLRKQKSDTISSQPKPFKAPAQEDKKEDTSSKPLSERIGAFSSHDDGRLTSLPKPKVANSVASRFNPGNSGSSNAPAFGSKPNFGSPSSNNKDNVIGGISRNFGAEGGKTPAQIWAEKRGQYKSVEHTEEPVHEEEHEHTESNVASLTNKFKQQAIEDEDEDDQPKIIKPSSGGFPAPPKRVIPSFASKDEDEEEQEEEEEEEEEEEKPAPVSLPARNLPPPPVRTVAPVAAPEPEEEEEEEEEKPAPVSLPARNLPPPPVRTVAAEPVPVAPSSNGKSVEEPKKSVTAVAEYDYEKDEENEIGFAEGDLIIEIEFADEEWWSGKHEKTGEVGLFPAAYVVLKEEKDTVTAAPVAAEPAVIKPAPVAAPAATASVGKTAIAEYDYEKDEDNEIEFSEGDKIIEIEFVDEDWWSGKHSKTGEVGLFPANYVKLDE